MSDFKKFVLDPYKVFLESERLDDGDISLKNEIKGSRVYSTGQDLQEFADGGDEAAEEVLAYFIDVLYDFIDENKIQENKAFTKNRDISSRVKNITYSSFEAIIQNREKFSELRKFSYMKIYIPTSFEINEGKTQAQKEEEAAVKAEKEKAIKEEAERIKYEEEKKAIAEGTFLREKDIEELERLKYSDFVNEINKIKQRRKLSSEENSLYLAKRNAETSRKYRFSHKNIWGEIDKARVVKEKYWTKEDYAEYYANCKGIPYRPKFVSNEPDESRIILSHKKPKRKLPLDGLLKIFSFKTFKEWKEFLDLEKQSRKNKENERKERNQNILENRKKVNQRYSEIRAEIINKENKLRQIIDNKKRVIAFKRKVEYTPWGSRSKLRSNYLFPSHLDVKNPSLSIINTNKTVNEVHGYFNEIFAPDSFESAFIYSDDFYDDLQEETYIESSQKTWEKIAHPSKNRVYRKASGIGTYSGAEKERQYIPIQTIELSPVLLSKYLKKVKYDTAYPCMAAATYFQLLVASTPIDEKYYITYESIKKKSLKKKDIYTGSLSENIKLKDNEEISNEYSPEIIVRKKIHNPDKEIVRADWILNFRGLNFKAFKSAHSKYSKDIPSSCITLEEEYFIVPGDREAIEKIADILFEKSKELSDERDFSWNVYNINPRWEILELGGYLNDTLDHNGNPAYRTGISQYGFKHGAIDGFSYQAPNGFKKFVDSYYESKIKANRGYVAKFINKKIENGDFNVSDVSSKIIKRLIENNPTLGQKERVYIKNEVERIEKS